MDEREGSVDEHDAKPGEVVDPLGGAQPEGGGGRSVASFVADWLRSLAIALVLFVFVRTFGVEAFKIPTGSMEETLLVGDFLLVNKAAYGTPIPGTDLWMPSFTEPERGDVIVFHPPHEPDRNYVKRVVGAPGDTLQMRDKQLFLNGAPVDEPYARILDAHRDAVHPNMRWQRGHLIAALPDPDDVTDEYEPTRDNWGPLVVPPDRFFVLGDNRDYSEDSRYWGFVERDQIRGSPWLVYYSAEPPTTHPGGWIDRVRWRRFGSIVR